MAKNRTLSESQKDNEKSKNISVYEFIICFLDDSYIRSTLGPHHAESSIVLDSTTDPGGDKTEEEETVNTKCNALMFSDTHKQNKYNHSSERKNKAQCG